MVPVLRAPVRTSVPRDGDAVERPYVRELGALHVDLGRDVADVDHLEIGWPSSRLAELVLIDTPGIASISTDVSARTHEAMSSDEERTPIADAVLYLLRHTHASDIRFLESFHDGDIASGTPVNTVGVLSRADEIGSSLLDAMDVAARVARRYQADTRLHRLCPVVVPVNGLLGYAGTTLRESEYAALATVARGTASDVEELLLTADRFSTSSTVIGVPAEQRDALLERLGLFGVRYAVELIRAGSVATSSDLARRLTDVSGLGQLVDVVEVQFETRSRVLKARTAVAALRGLLSRGACSDGPELLGRLEEVTSSAHEFEEVRILVGLRAGELSLSPERSTELDLLMGGSGHDEATRLGLANGASAEQKRAASMAALEVWQGIERHPLSSRSTQIAARGATRTLEGIVSTLAQMSPSRMA